ncbi:hypothetical protein ABZ759_28610 [Streptomyces sp. NPDC047860]|uniref:hypothetical protein n=1 Tax=Streptomyces sp. NPDC047860 TaxID=3155743 RepID=UPI0033EB8A4F
MSSEPRHTAVPLVVRLERHGRMPWPQARTLLAGTTCAWADLDGFHILPATKLPDDRPPLATHLWAWSEDRCLRLRLDGAQALVAALHLQGASQETDESAVRVYVRSGVPWPSGHDRVGPLPDAAETLTFELLELAGPAPATFVRATT